MKYKESILVLPSKFIKRYQCIIYIVGQSEQITVNTLTTVSQQLNI